MSGLHQLLQAALSDTTDLDLANFSPATVRHAIATGLGPTLFRATRDGRRPDESPLAQELLSADLSARVLVHGQLDALEEILTGLGEHAQQVTLLKGISICQTHYPAPHLRLMGDIDLLVPPEMHSLTEEALRDLGYRQQSVYPEEFYRTLHHSMPFFHPRQMVWVEVHRGLFPPRNKIAGDQVFSSTHIANQSVPHVFRGLPCRRLLEELHIVYTCSHWAQAFDSSHGLIPLLDVLLLAARTNRPLDWETLLRQLAGSMALNHLSLAVSYLHDRGLSVAPLEVERKLNRQARSLNRASRLILGQLIDRYHSRGRPFGRVLTESNIGIVWESLLTPAPAWRNLTRLPWNVIFPPGATRRRGMRFQLGRIFSALGISPRP